MDACQTNPYAPISKLNNDLLYEIFYTNAASDPPNGFARKSTAMNPLIVTQRTSHVCKEWNTIIIQSPSIWARCFNLDALRQTTSDWHDLVLRRTGTSLLSVTGTNSMPRHSGFNKFLLQVLHRHWSRIRDFDVFLSSSAEDWPVTLARIMQIFGRPAENLRTFVLHIYDNYPLFAPPPSFKENCPTFRLFSNHAPSLVHLSIETRRLPVQFTDNFMLSGKMRHLHLPNHALELTDIDLLTAFLQMPLLEEVRITIHKLRIGTQSGSHSPRPSLPRLKRFHIYSSGFDIYPALLDKIDPAWGCEFFFKHDIDQWNTSTLETETWPEMKHLARIAEHYARRHFDHHKPQSVAIQTSIQGLNRHRFIYACCPQFLKIDVEVSVETVKHAMIERLFNTLLTLDLPSPVNQLELYASSRIFTASSDLIRSGLKALSSVTNLIATSGVFSAISSAFYVPTDEFIFPLLNTLSIIPFQSLQCEDIYKAIIQVVLDRQRTVSPIESVVFLRGRNPDHLTPRTPKVHTFDQFTDLKIVWYERGIRHEYICGVGIKK